MKKFSAELFTLLMAAVFLTPITGSARNLRAGAVYVLTNQISNSIAVFERNPDGTLTPAGVFSTGGAGDPVAQPGDPPTDPLASQGSLILDDNQFLFAVNAGSNEISVLRIGKNDLTLVDKESSGGVRPISLTLHENLLYVLNEGGTPNITGFTVGGDGSLTPLAGSTRSLAGGAGSDPAQVGFSPDGSLLTVTEKLGNQIDIYIVGVNGIPGASNPDLSSGLTPFGFAFRNDGVLVISEAFGGAPNQGKASSYSIGDGLSVISRSVPNSQTATSRVVITDSGKLVFVSNTGSSAISSYQLDVLGTLSLLHSVAGNTGTGSTPIDIALSDKSRFLYVNDNGLQMVHSFAVNKDGSLTLIDSDGGLPFGVQGIAAR
jgi:6-phosphogluconolactonase